MTGKPFILQKLGIDHIPIEWRLVELRNLIRDDKPIVYGIVQAGPHVEGGVPYIKSTDLNRQLSIDDLQRTSDEIAARYKRSEVVPGDIVFSLRGNTGEACVVPASIPFANLTQGTARLAVNGDNVNTFVRYVFGGPPAQRVIRAVSKGSTFTEVSIEELRKFPLLMPPLPEQQKIAAILSTWDRAIELTEKLIAAKQKRKQALMQQLLTGKMRFKEFESKSWKWVELCNLTRPVKRSVDWDEQQLYKLASIRRHSKGMFFREPAYGHQIKVKKLFTVEQDDFLISNIQAAYGAMGLVPQTFDGAFISDQYTVLQARDRKEFDIRFLGFISETAWFRHQVLLACNGFFAERLRLLFSADELLKRRLFVPTSIKEQSRIVQVLQTAVQDLRFSERKMERLKEQKKGLMQQLLSGKIRVNVDAELMKG